MKNMNNKNIRISQIALLITNIVTVMAVSIFVMVTTYTICRFFRASTFLQSVKAIPWDVTQIVMICAASLTVLTLDMILREYYFAENVKVIRVTLVIDFLCSFAIIIVLHFNYNGVLLLVFANVIKYIEDKRWRYFLLTIAIVSYLLTDYDLLAVTYPLYSVLSYIQYYNTTVQQYVLCIYKGLLSINFMMFMIYCLNVINSQKDRIEQINNLYRQLENANNQLQEYTMIAEKMVQARERNRLAREIHDTLGHTLTGISAGVDACIAMIDLDTAKTKAQLERISDVIRDGLNDVRRSVSQLRPDSLERFSLEHAITKMVTNINSVSNAKVYFYSKVKNLKFDQDEEHAIYRVIQEGITNALRHGKADKIWIHLDQEYQDIMIQIKDNGIGCEHIKSGFGTKHMQERISLLGGTVTFSGKNGFEINAKIPIRLGETHGKGIDCG